MRANLPQAQDHTRMCGKNVGYTESYACGLGSHPRVREKLEFLRCQLALLKDHTRVCGKNSARLEPLHPETGSHPRVREKLENLVGR